MKRAGLLGLAAATLLAACVLPQKEEPRAVAIDTQSLGLQGPSWRAVPEGWWKTFGDPQLDQLIDQALLRNPSLSEALARLRAAQAEAQAAGGADKPRLTLDGSAARQRLSENYIYPSAKLGIDPHGGGVYWLSDLGLNLSWDLDFWGRQAEMIRQARLGVQAAELDRAAARLALAGAIAQAYIDLYRAYEFTDLASATLAQRQAQQQLSQQRLQAGMDSQLQAQTARAQQAQAQAELQQAQALRELVVHRLAALSGHGADAYAQIQRPQLRLEAALPLPQALPLDLLAHRPDVLAAQARVQAADAGREAARAAFYPDISLSAFAGYQSVGLDQLFTAASASYGAGPSLHLPIFDAQRLRAGYRHATAALDDAVAQYNHTVLDAVRDVADQLSLVASLQQQQQAQAQQHEASETALQLAQKRYQAGLSSRLPVLDVQTQALQSRRALIDTSCRLVTSRVSLLLLLGGSFQADNLEAADGGKSSS